MPPLPLAPRSIHPDTPLPPASWRYWAVLAVVVGGFFAIDTNAWWLFRQLGADTQGLDRALRIGALRYLPALLAILFLTALITGPRRVLSALGLRAPILPALGFAALCTLPLPLLYSLAGEAEVNADTLPDLLQYALFPGIFEEVFYRAFLFGLLYRLLGWGFLWSALAAAAIFAAGHLYQSTDLIESLLIIGVTLVAGLWWAWLFVRWGFNLWVPIAFHLLMNAWFIPFAVGDTAAGTTLSIAARLLVVVLSVALTLRLRPT